MQVQAEYQNLYPRGKRQMEPFRSLDQLDHQSPVCRQELQRTSLEECASDWKRFLDWRSKILDDDDQDSTKQDGDGLSLHPATRRELLSYQQYQIESFKSWETCWHRLVVWYEQGIGARHWDGARYIVDENIRRANRYAELARIEAENSHVKLEELQKQFVAPYETPPLSPPSALAFVQSSGKPEDLRKSTLQPKPDQQHQIKQTPDVGYKRARLNKFLKKTIRKNAQRAKRALSKAKSSKNKVPQTNHIVTVSEGEEQQTVEGTGHQENAIDGMISGAAPRKSKRRNHGGKGLRSLLPKGTSNSEESPPPRNIKKDRKRAWKFYNLRSKERK